MVHWLGLCSLTAKGKGSIPGKGTKITQAVQYGSKLDKCQFYDMYITTIYKS